MDMMSKIFLKNIRFLAEICSDGKRMAVKENKVVGDQLITIWKKCYTKKF